MMMTDKRPILVFGATGQQGGSVVTALRKAGWPVRALVRDPLSSRSVTLRAAGVDLVQGSFADVDVLRDTMKDAHGVFSVLPGDLAQDEEVHFGCRIADLAAESGVAHFVYSSGASVGETMTGVARFDAKPKIEAHIRKLPITASIVRPMIFMEMLVRPLYGLDKGQYTFFLRPDQAMQLIAVEDIGRVVAAIFADKARFAGATLKIAGDTVTGHDLQAIFTEAAGKPISYARLSDEFLSSSPDLQNLSKSLENGPLADHVDLEIMRQINPEIISFRSWIAGTGRSAFENALRINS
jgi:uncharacterized protein YbjT (DUF2867 family)